MKKKICLIAALGMSAALIFSGCGNSGGGESAAGNGSAAAEQEKADPEAEVRAAAEGFLDCLEKADYEGMKAYCTDAVMDDETVQMMQEFQNSGDEMIDAMGLEEMGITKDILSEETKQSVADFVNTFVTELVAGYELSEVAVSGDSATAGGTIQFGFDTSLENISDEDMDEIFGDEAMDEYLAENQEELTKVAQEEGMEAVMVKMMDDLLPAALDHMKEMILETDGGTDGVNLTLVKKDGKWLVNDFNIPGLDANSETSNSET